MKRSLLSVGLTAFILSGCSLIPEYHRPETPVATQWPQGPADSPAAAAQVAAAEQGWRQVFQDPALKQLIQTALLNNRDLRVAALNIQAYRAQYRIQRAEQVPQVSANANGSRQRLSARVRDSGNAGIDSQYAVTLGVSAYELDLFGRVRSLSEEALQTYLSSEQARRSIQISLVASVANAYFTWQADQALLALTQDTLQSYQESFELTRQSHDIGTATALDVSQAKTSVESARASYSKYQRQVAQDRNQLALLLGTGIPDDLAKPFELEAAQIAQVPAGLPSDLLTRRPDILQAEHLLQAANANIGAARAAFFPSISLTANAGTLSPDMGGLFKGGSGTWLFQPHINLPIFTAGRLKANLDYAKIQKNIDIARYEKTIQTAFQEVADGLAARTTYAAQLQAQRDLVGETRTYYELAEQRYRLGVDNHLVFLDAQRSLFGAQQALILERLSQLTSEVNLYKALGGGWQEDSHIRDAGDIALNRLNRKS